MVLEFWFGHPKCHFGTPKIAKNTHFGPRKSDFWPFYWFWSFFHWNSHWSRKILRTAEGRVVHQKQNLFWKSETKWNNLKPCKSWRNKIFRLRITLPTHLTLRARLFTCSWLGSLSSSPLRTTIVLILWSVPLFLWYPLLLIFCLLSSLHISVSFISTCCCWRSPRQGPDHPRPPPAGNTCPDSPGGRESESDDDKKVKVRVAEKVKVAETRPSVNYAKDWLDHSILFPGLVWSEKEFHFGSDH